MNKKILCQIKKRYFYEIYFKNNNCQMPKINKEKTTFEIFKKSVAIIY